MAEQPNPPSQAKPIAVFREDQQSIELTVTPELLELLDQTALINRGTSEGFHYSFSGLLIAFYYGRHGISAWFKEYISEQRVDFSAILRYRKISEEELRKKLDEYSAPFADPNKEYPGGRRTATVSAFHWIETARDFAQEQRHAWTGLRHMMGAVIFNPKFHAEDLERWHFDRRAWASSYLEYASHSLPDDLDFWSRVYERTFDEAPEVRATSWLSQADIDRFSNEVHAIVARADQARKNEKKDRVYTEHLVFGLNRPQSQLWLLAAGAKVDLNTILKTDFGASVNPAIEFHGLPPISRNARGAFLTARGKANADGSKTIEESHLLFGVLSQSESRIVQELNRQGITADKVSFASPVTPPPPPPPEGAASAHIATDSWTVVDTLGHDAYARAIYRFITDEKTEAPLAISIQAPWGGGKTSLMRMVQKELDPEVVDKLEQERRQRRDRNRGVPERIEPGKLKEELGADALQLKDVVAEIRKWRKSASRKEIENPIVSSAASEKGSEQKRSIPSWFSALKRHFDKLLGRSATPRGPSPRTGPDGKEHRITVWFNAWKYESTEQVWAGLADCIMRQVTGRMSVIRRQRFWLQLQLSRLDTESLQRRILERILAEWWSVARPWIWATLGLIILFLVVVLTSSEWPKWIQIGGSLRKIGIGGSLVTAVAGALQQLYLYAKAKSEVKQEPAELSLSTYLQVPDYRGKAGFIHQVAEDLNRVINAIPPNELPIVIFIDDLDRCSPQKVAEVTEGINLFLAGEFPDCIFVFGMDAEMVAAALERAHSDVIAKLPAYAADIPVGWRFMDKFVQLPFVIPPPETSDLTEYVESLLEAEAVRQPIPQKVQEKIEDVAREHEVAKVSEAAENLKLQMKDLELSASQQREAVARLERVQKLATIDAEIDRASRDTETVRTFVVQVAPDLFRNPRDLKRFLNTFRLHDFLRVARARRNLPAPSRELIAKWILLSLKWPQVVRWMHRVPGDEGGGAVKKNGTASLKFRLQQLEVFAGEVPNPEGVEKWTQLLNAALGPEVKESKWISDPALFEFFWKMGHGEEADRLSFGAGKGLW